MFHEQSYQATRKYRWRCECWTKQHGVRSFHYINERSSTILEIDQISFVKVKQSREGERCQQLIQPLFVKLVEAGKAQTLQNTMEMEGLFLAVCIVLKHSRSLPASASKTEDTLSP